jgi:nitrite reductase/ring-hydroxylating ferredoxin subunit
MIRVCGVDEVTEKEGLQVTFEDRSALAVFRIGDEFFVIDDQCTHSGASLGAEGWVEGYTVECAWHSGRFDLRTGAVMAPPCPKPVRSYKVTIADGAVYIEP